jgi:ArsR family metal-binding transcriptional regulator
MLIEKYDLDIFTPPCDPNAIRYAAKARLTTDISEALPYLNATLDGALYHKGANSLTWKKGKRAAAFRDYEIAVSNLEDREEAKIELQELIDLVNQTWEERESITPSYEETQRPTSMAVYQLLPRTNCKKCGELTCYNYALKLTAGQISLELCPPLCEAKYAENLASLKTMLG